MVEVYSRKFDVDLALRSTLSVIEFAVVVERETCVHPIPVLKLKESDAFTFPGLLVCNETDGFGLQLGKVGSYRLDCCVEGQIALTCS